MPPRRPAPSDAPVERAKRETDKLTIALPAELASRMRAAVFYTPGLTVTALVERGVEAEIGRLERKRGEAFPAPTGPVRRGRPMKLR